MKWFIYDIEEEQEVECDSIRRVFAEKVKEFSPVCKRGGGKQCKGRLPLYRQGSLLLNGGGFSKKAELQEHKIVSPLPR